jgi:hypothetical protein
VTPQEVTYFSNEKRAKVELTERCMQNLTL